MTALDRAQQSWIARDSEVAGGGGGPHDGGMRERLAAIEAILPTLASRADVEGVRTSFEQGQKENRAWMLATVIALFLGCLAIGNFLASGLDRVSPSPAPIVLQLPAPPPPPAPTPPEN